MSDTDAAMEKVMPLLKRYLDLANSDREATKEVISELKEASKESRECSLAIKLQMKGIETQFTNFIKNCANRKIDCMERFVKIEDKLEQIPSPESISKIEKKLEKLPSDDYKNIKDKQFDNLEKLVKIVQTDQVTLKNSIDGMKLKIYTAIGVGFSIITLLKWAWDKLIG